MKSQGFLREQIAEFLDRKNDLNAEQTDYANQEVQIRLLLELVDQLILRPQITKLGEKEKKEEKDEVGSCYDYEKFFRLTSYTVPKRPW